MKLEVEIAGAKRSVEIQRAGGRLSCSIDGRAIDGNIVELGNGVYSFIIEGRSIEVRVESRGDAFRVTSAGHEFVAAVRDPRRYRAGRAGAAAEGRQHVNAPMPGKVVHLLVSAGDTVEAGQGLLVVEAMKMQNEMKASRAGRILSVTVKEGATVAAGEVLATIE